MTGWKKLISSGVIQTLAATWTDDGTAPTYPHYGSHSYICASKANVWRFSPSCQHQESLILWVTSCWVRKITFHRPQRFCWSTSLDDANIYGISTTTTTTSMKAHRHWKFLSTFNSFSEGVLFFAQSFQKCRNIVFLTSPISGYHPHLVETCSLAASLPEFPLWFDLHECMCRLEYE